MLLPAVDDRLAAAVVSCGITENVAGANFNPRARPTTENKPGGVRSGRVRPLGSALSDGAQALLVMVSQRDFFGAYSPNYLTSGTEEYQKLQRVYRTLGQADLRLVRHAVA